MWKRTLFAATLSLAVGAAQAATIEFGFDSTGTSTYTDGFTVMDWVPGNALAVGGNPSGGLQTGDTGSRQRSVGLSSARWRPCIC